MADSRKPTTVKGDDDVAYGTNRPLQVLPYSEKDEDWFKSNINSCIQRSIFTWGNKSTDQVNPLRPSTRDLSILYDAYNNVFPLEWFSHVTDPLSAKNPRHKAFPAKIRPVTILRTNLDLLLGEYPRRPFIYQVKNIGEDGVSAYRDGLKQQVKQNYTQHFQQAILQQEQQNGRQLSPEEQQKALAQIPLPEEIQTAFQGTYTDMVAVKGQKWLNRKVEETELRRKLHKGFKHWLIAGEVYSFKGVEHNDLVYRIVSPLSIDYDKSADEDFVEDGEWVVARYLWTAADIVDQFYEELSEKETTDIDRRYRFSSPAGFYDSLKGVYTSPDMRNKIPVYHVQWKGRKKIGFLSYLDMETFQFVEEVVDEDYKVNREKGEQVEWRWVNEVYEGWRIGSEPGGTAIYPRYRALPVQRNEMNNHSACKLSYNGRKYSDLHSQSISVLELGLPFQILYIIITYILEKTIAKSKGKIFLFDHNSIPHTMGEEKFFYYCEALGYGALDRNQVGVDKTWNQYTVVDMSLFDQIEQLIKIQDYCKQQWDDVLGIARQRKGETYSSDGQGVNERAVFQSTVITDMIFIPYEEFHQRELQGLLDYAKFLTAKGDRALVEDDDLGTMLMEIFPEDFSMTELGIRLINSTDEQNKLKQATGLAQAMLQNKVKTSQVLEVLDASNMAELKMKIKQIEDIEAQLEQQTAQSQQEHEQQLEQMKEKYLMLGKLADRQTMHEKMDREEDIEWIKQAGEIASLDKGDKGSDTINAFELAKQQIEGKKLQLQGAESREKLAQSREKLNNDTTKMQHDIQMDHKNHELKKKEVKIKAKVANKPRPPGK